MPKTSELKALGCGEGRSGGSGYVRAALIECAGNGPWRVSTESTRCWRAKVGFYADLAVMVGQGSFHNRQAKANPPKEHILRIYILKGDRMIQAQWKVDEPLWKDYYKNYFKLSRESLGLKRP